MYWVAEDQFPTSEKIQTHKKSAMIMDLQLTSYISRVLYKAKSIRSKKEIDKTMIVTEDFSTPQLIHGS